MKITFDMREVEKILIKEGFIGKDCKLVGISRGSGTIPTLCFYVDKVNSDDKVEVPK